MLKRNDKKDRPAGPRSTVGPGAEGSEAPGPPHEPEKPTFRQNLAVFIKILAIAGGIILLIWFLDKNVSGG